MNAKGAREIVEMGWGIDGTMNRREFGLDQKARGYLACLEGEEVKELEDRLETLANALPPNAISMHIKKALSKYHEAIKGE